ncbi:MAG: Omp28-related outer membrane protein, partial [Alistipes sp.]|nr:Omp28-related outer membrane protein [Alistipes sp.]
MKLTKFFAIALAALAFVACSKENSQGSNQPNDPQPTGDITLKADKTAVAMGETVTFTVTDAEGQDVTSQASIYDEDFNDVGSTVTFNESGSYEFFATLGSKNSNYVTVVVMAEVPEVPADPQPENFKFNHRSLVIDHTGVNCGYCPGMTDKLLSLAETEWHQYYNEVTCHAGSMAGGDPGNSAAANALNQFQSSMIDGYPNICINFYTATVGNYGWTTFLSYMGQALESYIKKDGADVGISLAVTGDEGCVYAAAQVKSGVAQEYKITAWLLESNIYSPNQSGATKDYHKIYNNALRNMSHQYSKTNVQGDSYTFEAKETKDLAFELPIISTKWDYTNMSVLVVVSAKDANGRWEVANSAVCKISESKEFEYEL